LQHKIIETIKTLIIPEWITNKCYRFNYNLGGLIAESITAEITNHILLCFQRFQPINQPSPLQKVQKKKQKRISSKPLKPSLHGKMKQMAKLEKKFKYMR